MLRFAEIGRLAGRAGKLQDVHTGVGAINRINVAPAVHFDVVGFNDAITVKERIRFVSPSLLEDRITVTDPKALTKTWKTVKAYRKATSGTDELREFACPEGLGDDK